MFRLVYTYVSSQVQNIFFNKFFSNLDVKAFLQDNTILIYNCADSGFIDKDHQHIIIGDLRIVGNNKFRKLITKGPKYKETNNISWEKAKSTIIKGLNDCIDTWCSKHGIDKSLLMEWKDKVINKVDGKIKTLSNKTSFKI